MHTYAWPKAAGALMDAETVNAMVTNDPVFPKFGKPEKPVEA